MDAAYRKKYGHGIISRVGVPQYEEAPVGFGSLSGKNAGLTGGPTGGGVPVTVRKSGSRPVRCPPCPAERTPTRRAMPRPT